MKCAIFEEHSSSCVVYFRFSGTLFPVSMIDGDLQYRENVHFLLPSLILRLYTGCHLDKTLSKYIACFKKVKVLKC